jgi:hypothetical protein
MSYSVKDYFFAIDVVLPTLRDMKSRVERSEPLDDVRAMLLALSNRIHEREA